ncbi:hypothetical protein F8M41_011417 [Gigaspora margarita]|uniref:Uncharacterized protein n=1 Tax=Gigaspora margarita TaxID=4874 RepID=A0A8H3X133_GIGMA|nr:hypothetical protein F8M41_011417 [Gigaspora margarita]
MFQKNETKKEFLPPGEGESNTEDEEDEVVEEERGRGKKRRKSQQSENGKRVRRTKSPINISDSPKDLETSEKLKKNH